MMRCTKKSQIGIADAQSIGRWSDDQLGRLIRSAVSRYLCVQIIELVIDQPRGSSRDGNGCDDERHNRDFSRGLAHVKWILPHTVIAPLRRAPV